MIRNSDHAMAQPANESLRLATLQALKILDTPAEERFDRLTRLARKLFDMPVAAVTLVDLNQVWFKSCAGTDVRSVPRDISFCTHALTEGEVLLIPDTLQDRRFSANPLVVNDPKFRFYAGCPLHAANGMPVGTLCVLDTRPRTFNADDIAALRDLAAMAERELAALSMATTDELTSISNRRGFLVLARQALAACSRAECPATLLMFDLDNFKQVNDAYGHAEGDHALRVFARLLTKVFRSSDVIARLGGDEFLVMLTHTNHDEVRAVLARFHEQLASLNSTNARGYSIACSIGTLGIDPKQGKPLDVLLAEVDKLMYVAKRDRRRTPLSA